MAVHQVKWDKYETALLIEAYWKIKTAPSQRIEIAAALSSTLRDRASFEIDATFRDVNGMIMSLAKIDYLFSDGTSGLENNSEIFREIAELYQNNRAEFDKILAEAKGINPETSDLRQQFCEWLKENAPELKPEDVCNLLTIAEDFCKKRGVLKNTLFEMTDVDTINDCVDLITRDIIFRLRKSEQHTEIVNAVNLYYKFVQNFAKTPLTAEEENKLEKLPSEGNGQEDSQTDDNIVSFHEKQDYSDTKPLWYKYQNKIIENVSSWTDLYTSLMKQLAKEHPTTFVPGMSILSGGKIDIAKSSDISKLRRYSQLTGDLYIEEDVSTNGLLERLVRVASWVGLTEKDIEIHYIKLYDTGNSYAASKDTNSSDRSISVELKTSELTMSYDGTPDDNTKPLWFRYKNNPQVPVKSWSELYVLLMRQLAKEYENKFFANLSILNGSGIDIVRNNDLYLLSCPEKLTSDLSIEINRSPQGFMRRIGAIANRVGLTEKDIEIHYIKQVNDNNSDSTVYYSSDNDPANNVSTTSLSDQVNEDIQDDYDNNINLQFDIKPFEAVLAQNFPDGYTLGSFVSMLKFVYAFEKINGSLPKLESDEIEGIIVKCGIKHDDRIYSPQSLLSDELRDKLFSFIDEKLERGHSEVYFEDLFNTFSKDFKESNMHDAEMLKAYIERMSDGKYAINEDYFSSKRQTIVDSIKDVHEESIEQEMPSESDESDITLTNGSDSNIDQADERRDDDDPSYDDKIFYDRGVPAELEPFEAVLVKRYSNGYKLNNSSDIRWFRSNFRKINGYELQLTTENIEEKICLCGIENNGRIFALKSILNDDLNKRLFNYIDKNFENGKSLIYFNEIFDEFSEEFRDHNMYDDKMLRAYISRINSGKYVIYGEYLSKGKESADDYVAEVRNCLKEHGMPMGIYEICNSLNHIPQSRIIDMLETNDEFVFNSKGHYFHVDSFLISDNELDDLSNLIETELEDFDFITLEELYDLIRVNFPSIYTHNALFSISGWRHALKYKLNDRFSIKGNIISNKNIELSLSGIFENFGAEHERFTLDELLAFSKSINCLRVDFDGLYKKTARVSHDLFVNKKLVSFPIEEIDDILDSFCTGKYLALSEIKNFSNFPKVLYPWTEYLLEHYLAFHSKRYYLLHSGYYIKKFAGVMVKKSVSYGSFDDLVVDILAESDLPLDNKSAINYLYNKGYTAQLWYTGLDDVMIKARAKRKQLPKQTSIKPSDITYISPNAPKSVSKADEIKTLFFGSGIEDKEPKGFGYKNQVRVDVNSWKELYSLLMKKLSKDYPSAFYAGMTIISGCGVDVVKIKEAYKLRQYSFLAGNLLIETDLSADEMIDRMVVVFSQVGLTVRDLTIYYKGSKVPGKRRTERTDSNLSYTKEKYSEANELTISFKKIQDYSYTKPVWFIYKNNSKVSVKSWANLYILVMELLVKDYPSTFVADMSILSGGNVDIVRNIESGRLRTPIALTKDLLIEVNISTNAIIKRIAKATLMVGLTEQDIIIHYVKPTVERRSVRTNSHSHQNDRSTDSLTPKLIEQVTELIRNSADGIKKSDLYNSLSDYSNRQIDLALESCHAVLVLDKCYHRDNISDYQEMSDIMLEVLTGLFSQNGNYVSAKQLYIEVKTRLDDFFFYNNAFDSRPEVYDLAVHLFEQEKYKGNSFIFMNKVHIWKEEPDYPKDYYGLLIKYAREHGNIFSREEAISYFDQIGAAKPPQTAHNVISNLGSETFLQYAENQFVLAEAIQIDEYILDCVKIQIENLLEIEGEDYFAIGEIGVDFYTILPRISSGINWSALLLKDVLRLYDIGFATIEAGEENDKKTIPAAIIRKNSYYRSFSDVVWNEVSKSFTLPKEFTATEFREFLCDKGFIRSSEKKTNVHKTVIGDIRFLWTDNNEKVIISK